MGSKPFTLRTWNPHGHSGDLLLRFHGNVWGSTEVVIYHLHQVNAAHNSNRTSRTYGWTGEWWTKNMPRKMTI